MSGIYDDGATYGPDPDAQIPTDAPADPIYDDGAQYGMCIVCPDDTTQIWRHDYQTANHATEK